MGLTYEGKRRFLANPNDKRHGTITGYNYGCRCDSCSEVGRAKAKERRERQYQRQLEKAREARAAEKAKAKKVKLKDCCTINELYLPLMGKPNIDNANGVCCICGRPASDRHHIVKRSAGKWVVDGREVKKPTVRLCGSGNASGCHGMAHKGLIHFRWAKPERNYTKDGWQGLPFGSGHWEYLITSESVKYQEALEMDGWRKL